VTRSAAAAHLLPSSAGRTGSRLDIRGRGDRGPSPIGRDAIAWAARALRRYEMPPEEIGAVLGADNPELVRRYTELHRERLEERLVDRVGALAGLERSLIQTIGERPRLASPDRSRKGSMPA
jgi:hypothetical protein